MYLHRIHTVTFLSFRAYNTDNQLITDTRCESLTKINIPNSVTNIGNSTFSSCSSLTCINIPNSVTNIGNCAFLCCRSLANINIPDSVTDIGCGAFYACESLTKISIPNSVTYIENYAFGGYNRIPSKIKSDIIQRFGEKVFESWL